MHTRPVLGARQAAALPRGPGATAPPLGRRARSLATWAAVRNTPSSPVSSKATSYNFHDLTLPRAKQSARSFVEEVGQSSPSPDCPSAGRYEPKHDDTQSEPCDQSEYSVTGLKKTSIIGPRN